MNNSYDTHSFNMPPTPEAAMKSTIKIIEDLLNIYDLENETLQKSSIREFINLQDEKMKIAHHYQMSVSHIRQNKAKMARVSPSLKERLKTLQNKFSAITAQNLPQLERMHGAAHRLGRTLTKAAQKSARNKGGFTYSETGQLNKKDKGRISAGVNKTA